MSSASHLVQMEIAWRDYWIWPDIVMTQDWDLLYEMALEELPEGGDVSKDFFPLLPKSFPGCIVCALMICGSFFG